MKYLSEILNKPFDSIEELELAEKQHEEEMEARKRKLEEARKKEQEEKELREKEEKEVEEAINKAYTLLTSYNKKYGRTIRTRSFPLFWLLNL